MIIIAWSENSLWDIFQKDVIHKLSSIFITAACLHFIRSVLDIILNLGAILRWTSSDVMRNVLKVVFSLAWFLGLLGVYFLEQNYISVLKNIPLYFVAVGFYLLPYLLEGLLFILPPAWKRSIEDSDWPIIRLYGWWRSKPRLYVGRGMRESSCTIFKYTLFWILLLIFKVTCSFYYQIAPVIGPTKDIMKIKQVHYVWPELFPKGIPLVSSFHAAAVISLWLPVLLVYFMDMQNLVCDIFNSGRWYYWRLDSIRRVRKWPDIFHGFSAKIFLHLMDLRLLIISMRTLGQLRSRFQSVPAAFSRCLGPPKHLSGHAISKKTEALIFSELWNEIVLSFHEEDLISDREKDLMLVPRSSLFSQ